MITEKEKCRLGELYDANNDGELIAERQRLRIFAMITTGCVPLIFSSGKKSYAVCSAALVMRS